MPSPYTAPLFEGKPISFNEFIWRCARATAALDFMEGQPLEAPIPLHVEVDTSLLEEAKKVLAELEELQKMDPREVARLAHESLEIASEEYLKRRDKSLKAKKAYSNFLAMAEDWVPPADTYRSLKEFMISELKAALESDCNTEEVAPAYSVDLDDYHNKLVLEKSRRLLQLVGGYYEAVSKAFGQEEWIRNLHLSVHNPWPSTFKEDKDAL